MNYNQSIHSLTKHTPFSLLYGTYENEMMFDNNLPVYDIYNQKHKEQLEQLITETYEKMMEKGKKILNKRKEKLPRNTY